MKKFNLLVLLILISSAIGACRSAEAPDPSPEFTSPATIVVPDTYPVDPLFRDFYDFLGGMDTFGPAISLMRASGNLKTQYVSTALLIYDPQIHEGERYRLAPLGLILGVAEPAIEDPDPASVVVNGHVIDPLILPVYERLGGAQIVGRPLTEARFNPDYERYEQYFENLGFYIRADDALKEVHLLAYGAFECDRQCRYQPYQFSIPSQKPPLQEPFASKAANIGLTGTGKNITDVYLSEDGNLEVIFENLVLIVVPSEQESEEKNLKPNSWLPLILAAGMNKVNGEEIQIRFRLWTPQVMLIFPGEQTDQDVELAFRLSLPFVVVESEEVESKPILRPIVEQIGIRRRPMVKNNEDPLMVFYLLEGERGHNVPILYDSYLQRLGGLEISGEPISEVYSISGGTFRQCFENICLDFDPSMPPGEQLGVAPLGLAYKKMFYDQRGGFMQTLAWDDVRMKVWESKSFVSSKDTQEINILIAKDEIPLRDQEPILTITLPDNKQIEYRFPPTDEKGGSYLLIPPIPAPVGTLIAYEVCLPGFVDDDLCIGDHYLIWNNP